MKYRSIALFILLICNGQLSYAQRTIGLTQYGAGVADGYVLFAPIMSNNTYLIDKCGKEVHRWAGSRKPGQSVYLLEDGTLLRPGNTGNSTFNAGGSGGIIERFNWDGSLLWSYTISDTAQCQHHDICYLPNGNILAIVWEKKSAAEAIASGRDPSLLGTSLWSEKIVELHPSGSGAATIVWEWHAWDHLNQDYSSSLPSYDTISNHPELININHYSGMPTGSDWLHINSVAYNPARDEIMLSVHNFNEIWIIDHSTSIAEAAGHTGGVRHKGGDLLYRWGNPAAYDAGTPADKKLFGQHNAHWITTGADTGKIIVFNNGQGRPGGNYSSIDMLTPPVDGAGDYSYTPGSPYLPVTATWSYSATTPGDFYAMNISGVQRLSNGNTLICNGPAGKFFEIDASKNIVWEYINPVNNAGPMTQGTTPTQNLVFRCLHYDASYPGFSGHTLTPGAPIELSPLAEDLCSTTASNLVQQNADLKITTNNPFSETIVLTSAIELTDINIMLTDITGHTVAVWEHKNIAVGIPLSLYPKNILPHGIYLLTIAGKQGYSHIKLLSY